MTYFGKTVGISVLALACSAGWASAESVIRFTDQGPNRGERAEQMMKMFEAIEAKTEGRVKIDAHWGGSLMKASDALEGIQSGIAGMATITGPYFSKQLHEYLVGNLPVTVEDEVAGAKALYELATTDKDMLASFDRNNVVYVANYTVGPVGFACTGDAITKLDDFAGKKVRYSGDYGKMLEDAVGAVPVNLPLNEAYQALDTGVVDCSQSYGYATIAYKLFEPAKQYVLPRSGTVQANGIFMSKSLFDSLSAEDQKAILDAGYDMTMSMAEAIRTANKSAIDSMADGSAGNKLEIHTFSDEDSARMAEAGKPVIDAWVAESGGDGQAILDNYLALIAKYSSN